MTAIERTGVKAGIMVLAALALQACGPAKTGPAQLTPTQVCLQTLDPAVGIDACRSAVAYDQNNAAVRRRIALLRLKSNSLPAARQAYQIAQTLDPKDAEAQFGLGLTLEAITEPGANLRKLEAVKRDPTVVDKFRKYGFSEADLLTFDTAPKIISAPGGGQIGPLIAHLPSTPSFGVDAKCLVGATGTVHDCQVITPLQPDQAAFGEATKKIVMLTKVKPAKKDGKIVPDAPIILTMIFGR